MSLQTVSLPACRPAPLASYLKALAVFRLVAEQADRRARGYWKDDVFHLRSSLSEAELENFFLARYRPTPLAAPWNGGSGFRPKDKSQAVTVKKIADSGTDRFSGFRAVIAQCWDILRLLGVSEKLDSADKSRLLQACRARFPVAGLTWLDAAVVLSSEGPSYPPLLGTGGNDGRLEFTNNFMQRLLELIEPNSGEPSDAAAGWLQEALWDRASGGRTSSAVGQFLPGAAGGPNASSSFEGGSLLNPWDFVLMLEGAVLFAAALAARLGAGARQGLAAPFTVRPVAAGYASAGPQDERQARAEIWLPLWSAPASFPELKALLAEGRAQVGARPARDALDFARAVAALGVDRGLDQFQRYSFQERFGRTYLALPVGRFQVTRRPEVDLLGEIDDWLRSFRSKARAESAPASAGRALRRLEQAILHLCQRGGRESLQAVFLALGECERSLASSLKWAQGAFLRPLAGLSPQWLEKTYDGSAEFRLAAAAASLSARFKERDGRLVRFDLRRHLEPAQTFRGKGRLRARWTEDATDVVWRPGHLVGSLNAILARRLQKISQSRSETLPERSRVFPLLRDLEALLENRLDLARLGHLLWALVLIDWRSVVDSPWRPRPTEVAFPGGAFGVAALCFAGQPVRNAEVPIVPAIHALAAAGQGERAVRMAARRLRASGLTPRIRPIALPAAYARRLGAGLLFPLNRFQIEYLADRTLMAQRDDQPHERS